MPSAQEYGYVFIFTPVTFIMVLAIGTRMYYDGISSNEYAIQTTRFRKIVGVSFMTSVAFTGTFVVALFDTKGGYAFTSIAAVQIIFLFGAWISTKISVSQYRERNLLDNKDLVSLFCSRNWKGLCAYVREEKARAVVDFCIALIPLYVCWRLYFGFASLRVRECYEYNTTVGMDLALSMENTYIDSDVFRMEIMLTIFMSNYVWILFVYHFMIKQVVYSLRNADYNTSTLIHKNRRQKNLLSMKEREMKLMQSSWKINIEDIECLEMIGEGAFCKVYRALMNKTWIVALKHYSYSRTYQS